MKWPLLPALGVALVIAANDANAADAAAGKERYSGTCISCHGSTGKGMASFPSIAGRDADYIADRLMKYRAREQVGPNSAIMMSHAAELSDAEIANLALYISSSFQ